MWVASSIAVYSETAEPLRPRILQMQEPHVDLDMVAPESASGNACSAPGRLWERVGKRSIPLRTSTWQMPRVERAIFSSGRLGGPWRMVLRAGPAVHEASLPVLLVGVRPVVADVTLLLSHPYSPTDEGHRLHRREKSRTSESRHHTTGTIMRARLRNHG